MICRLIIMLTTFVMLFGCGIHVTPQPVPGSLLNPADNSISLTQDGVTVSARVQDLDVGPYTGESNITSFYVTIVNGTNHELLIPSESCRIFDEKNTQFNRLSPETVVSMTQSETDYLIPYPYVGYYYLQDQVASEYVAETSSSLKYTTENRPSDILADALPSQSLAPGAKTSGMVYFNIDLYLKELVTLECAFSGVKTMLFPFKITK